MDRSPFVDPTFLHGGPEGARHPAFTHALLVIFNGRSKHPEWVAVDEPMLAQHALWAVRQAEGRGT
jgi:hypothetical protein